ncbi:MAG: efflux RND transporter permease subunit [Planctomycetaceae bacterium]
MLNAIIRLALRQRLLVIALSMFLVGFGTWQATQMEIDVFPNLNRPRVVVITEAPGMAPEEVEALITFPLETTLNGANGVMAVHSSSGVGISVIYVEFEWGTDIYNDRQIVNERLALAQERMPPGIKPTLAPISSIMGQIFMMGMWSQENEKTCIDTLDPGLGPQLDAGTIPRQLHDAIDRQPRKTNAGGLSATAKITSETAALRCVIRDELNGRRFFVRTYGDRITVDFKDTDGKTRYFEIKENILDLLRALDEGRVPKSIASGIAERSGALPKTVTFEQRTVRWKIHDEEKDRLYLVRRLPGRKKLELHKLTTDLELRTIADWVVRQRLLTIPGVSQVFTMGGGRKQFQVLVDPDALLRYGISLHDVKKAVEKSNRNNTGGYLDDQGPNEFLVRALGRVQTIADLEKLAVAYREGRSVLLKQVARVVEAAQVKRGDSTAFMKDDSGNFGGGPAVVLTINKQPGADTREVTDKLRAALKELQPSLPADVRMVPGIYSQREFIDRAVFNVEEALADGGVLVVVLLFLFLMNFRTTFITLTAIPLSLAITALIFKAMGVSINTMTLGGIAVAIGELVDDAIVGVENVFRRLRENRHSRNPKNSLLLVFQASAEVRNPIVFGTMIVVLAFVPVFALEGMEGRLFAPLGLAYMVSILASLAVSLTLTPVLSYLLLTRNTLWRIVAPLTAFGISASIFYWVFPRFAEILHQEWMNITAPQIPPVNLPRGWTVELTPKLFWTLAFGPAFWMLIRFTDRFEESEEEGPFLRSLKWLAGGAIRTSLQFPLIMLLVAGGAIAVAGIRVSQFERDLLPPFNEGSVQLNVILPPGTSLRTSNQIGSQVEERLKELDFVQGFVRRTGRAELDEHAEGVNMSEFIVNLDPNSEKSREEILDEITEKMADIPGIVTTVEQPLAHLISHMLSGVKAQVAIKLYGDDLNVLRKKAREMEVQIREVRGVTGLLVEPQVVIPQLRIQVDRDKLLQYGLTPDDINEYVQTAMNGEVVSQVLLDQRTFDLLVRFDENYREDLPALRRLTIEVPDDGTRRSPDEKSNDKDRKEQVTKGRIPLEAVAKIYESGGPNTINREHVRRRIVVQCNVADRGLVDVVTEIQRRLKPIQKSLPPGYYIEYGGQFQAEKRASKRIAIMFAIAMIGVFLVLYMMFRSVNFSLQVMIALPMAFIGSVAALIITDQRLSVAAMVGFISLGGIASRNGILLLNHYLHLVKHEGEGWSKEMIVRAGKERLAPVLMTALTSGIGLLPLAMAAGEPGKEVLYPIATVIIGGLISSTLLEFIVRPALFWTFGRKAGARLVEESRSEVPLITEEEEAAQGTQYAEPIFEEDKGGR